MSLLDTPVREAAWVALDFEGSGVADGQEDEPVQIGIARWKLDQPEPAGFFRSLIRPARAITPAARSVHGIGDDEVQAAPLLVTLWPELQSRLSSAVVVAHGAGTEKRFLRAFPLHGFGTWLDTLQVARALLPGLGNHALSSVVSALGLEPAVRRLCPQLDWHDALFDAVACLVFLRRVIEEFDLGDLRVGQMLGLEASAYHARRHLRQTARDAGWLPEV